MKFKIIFYHPYFRNGGVEKTNLRLSEYFIEQGYQVQFWTFEHSNHFQEELDRIGIEVIDLKVNKASKAMPKIISRLRQEKENSIFISCQNYVNLTASLIKFFTPKNIKFIFAERNHPKELLINGGIKNHIIYHAMKLFYRNADYVISNSQMTADAISEFGIKKSISIYNPTFDHSIVDRSQEKISKKIESFTITNIGRLCYQKNQELLINAFQIATSTISDLRLQLIGDGEDLEYLKSLVKSLNIESKVEFLGFQKNPYPYLKNSQLYVHSARYEGLPNTIIEAMILGVPVISTNCPSGPSEILLNNEAGYLVSKEDHNELAEAIIFAFNNKQETIKRRDFASKNLYRFTTEVVSKKYLDQFKSLIQ